MAPYTIRRNLQNNVNLQMSDRDLHFKGDAVLPHTNQRSHLEF